MKPILSIIIVNYNIDELVLKAIESINNLVYSHNYEIIVVDNSYTDKLKYRLADKDIIYFKTTKNVGFGVANNIGFNLSSGKYIFLLNSDAYLIEDIFLKLIPFMEHPDNNNIAVCSPCLVDEFNNPSLCYGNFLTKKKILYDIGLYKPTQDEVKNMSLNNSLRCMDKIIKNVDWVSGAAMLLRTEIVKEYGLFNENYFMYYEDMEICYRYKKNNFDIVIIPDCTVVHLEGNSWNNSNIRLLNKYKIILTSKYRFASNFFDKHEIIFYKYVELFLYLVRRSKNILHLFLLKKIFR